MCTMSMVHDSFDKQLEPWFTPIPPMPYGPPPGVPIQNPESVKKIIDDFKKAREAAAIVDELTKQGPCLDPEKAKLLEKVERLEKIIDALLAAKKP